MQESLILRKSLNKGQLALVITCLGRQFEINSLSCIFENFDIAQMKREEFQDFPKSRG